jgi:phosphoribosylpyrophosphate synthetase
MLRGYKDDWSAPARRQLRAQTAALFGRFIADHGNCVREAAGSDWDAITVVPSSRGRSGQHPLEQALELLEWNQRIVTTLGPGPAPIDHNNAADDGYEVIRQVRSTRLPLVDDTLTSGARLQSAASALQLEGAEVVAAVVIGRFVNPEFNEPTAQLWARLSARQFDFTTCCLE